MNDRRHHRARSTAALTLWAVSGLGLVASTGVAAPLKNDEASAPMGTRAVPGVTIAVDREMEEASRVQEWVEERARTVFERRGVPLGAGESIRLELGGELFDYGIRIELSQGGVPLEPPRVITCECRTDEMLEQVGQALDAGADRLARAKLEEREAERADVAETMEPVPPASQVVPSRRKLSPIGIAGAVLTGLGGSAVVGGIVMTAQGRSRATGTDMHRNLRPVGVPMLVSGSMVLAAGVSALVIDAVRCRERRESRGCRRREERLAVVPTIDAGGAGVTLGRRF